MKNLNSVLNLPTPTTINYAWNFGSLLGLSLFVQIITGFFLSMHYSSNLNDSFMKVLEFSNEINMGWLLRFSHSTGASIFFIFCYTHIGKALIYESFYLVKVWISGLCILLLIMASAFLGYVLPWGQMSFWGATVITNLISVIPMVGSIVVEWLWGGFNVDEPTLNRFFSLHFIIPFLVGVMVVIHIILLHFSGSTNPAGISMNVDKVVFYNYYLIKDLVTLVMSVFFLLFLSVYYPFVFMDHENFIKANPMLTPPHIQPEWYFLFAYAILRSIPNKVGGVIMLLSSIFIILILPILSNKKIKGVRFNLFKVMIFSIHMGSFFMLTWLGSMPVEMPYVNLSMIYTILYFSFYFIYPVI